jgi:ABC-type lipoprotein release transport system permease subunit
MLIYVKLAWRNVLRNKRRSFIAGTAIGIGLAALIVTDALTRGMQVSMLHSATASFLGEGQIHGEGFRESFEVEKTIARMPEVLSQLRTDSLVERYTPRMLTLAMISSPANVNMVTMAGVDPTTERDLSQVDETLVEGAYFANDDTGALLIGSKLAEILEVGLGDRVVITAAQAHTGDLAQELFRISGIFHFGIQEMDRGTAYVHIATARRMLALPDEAHQIALKFTDLKYASMPDLEFWDRYSQTGNEAVGWPALLPQMAAAFKLLGVQMLIIGIILFGIVALGIINTLFMSLYERMFEFGVLRAVGTRPLAMGRLVLFEAAALGVIGVILGVIVGFVASLILAKTGIDYTGIEFAGATMRDVMYARILPFQYIIYPIIVFLVTALVGLYPALYAARLTPAVAMRKGV